MKKILLILFVICLTISSIFVINTKSVYAQNLNKEDSVVLANENNNNKENEEIIEENKINDISDDNLDTNDISNNILNSNEETTDDNEVETSDTYEFVTPPLTYIDNGFDIESLKHHTSSNLLMASYMDSSYSLVDEDRITDIKNQENYGTCWAFATIASAESTYLTENENVEDIDLSELQLAYFIWHNLNKEDALDLITKDGNTTTYNTNKYGQTCLDVGGNELMSTFTLTSGIGLIDEDKLKYSDAQNYINGNSDESLCYTNDYYVNKVTFLSMSETDRIKQAIITNGALASSYYHNNTYLNSNTGAYYCKKDNQTINHAITIIGWDDNYSRDNFNKTNRPSNNGAWLVKNSWGTTINDGYFWISYEDKTLSTSQAAQFFITKDFDYNIYQYDGSAEANYTAFSSKEVTIGNIFKSEQNEKLKKFSIFTRQSNVSYTAKVYVSNEEMDNPIDGTLKEKATVTGTLTDAGFYVLDLSNCINLSKNQYFSIVLTLSADQNIEYYYDWTNNYTNIQYTNYCLEGQSMYYLNNTWHDSASYNKCARIKAYTSNNEIKISDTLYYSIDDDGVLTILGSGEITSYVITSSNDLNSLKKQITKIIIEEGITSIGEYAFSDFSASVSISIPESVESIEETSFANCSALAEIIVDENNSYYKSSSNNDALIEIASSMLIRGCNDSEVPEGIKTIGSYAFSGCHSLTNIEFPSSLETIKSNAFYDCIVLKTITIPANVTLIDKEAFRYCPAITKITVNEENTVYDSRDNSNAIIETISNKLIRGCNETFIPNTVTSIGDFAFETCTFEYINIPNSITSIGERAFAFCNELKELAIPSSVIEIDSAVAFNSKKLEKLFIPSSVQTIQGSDSLDSLIFDCSNVEIYSDASDKPNGWSNYFNYYSLEDKKTVNYNSSCYLININFNNGSDIYIFNKCINAKIAKPADPIYLGKKFGGWYIDESLKNKFDFDTSITSNTTLYARWIEEGTVDVEVEEEVLEPGETIYIDGQPIEVSIEGKINIDNDATTAVSYTIANADNADIHTQYPTSMKVYTLEDDGNGGKVIVHHEELDDILTYAGASIRMTGIKGIRIITSIPTAKKNKLINQGIDGYKVMEYGTVMCWANDLEEDEEPSLYQKTDGSFAATHGAKGRAYSRTGNLNSVFSESGGITKYTNTLVDNNNSWGSAKCSQDFAMRSYIILRPTSQSDASKDIVIYGGTLYRSISYVAYQNRNSIKKGTAAYEYIWSLIRAGYGNQYDNEYQG